MFWTCFKRICKRQHTTPTAVLKALNLSTSKGTVWKNGSIPKAETLVALAQYLNCTVMEFFDEDEYMTNPAATLDEDEKEMVRIFRTLDRREKHEFMAMIYRFSAEIPSTSQYSIAAKNGDGVTVIEDKGQQKAVDRLIATVEGDE